MAIGEGIWFVDSGEKPAMTNVYEAMDRTKEQVQNSFDKVESRYRSPRDYWRTLEVGLKPLHIAGYYHNPR